MVFALEYFAGTLSCPWIIYNWSEVSYIDRNLLCMKPSWYQIAGMSSFEYLWNIE